jgi:hypothetical protein
VSIGLPSAYNKQLRPSHDYGQKLCASCLAMSLLPGRAGTHSCHHLAEAELDRAVHYSWHGALHDLFSLLAFVALAAACFVFGSRFAGRGERRWAIYSAVSGAVFAIAFVLSSAGFGQAAGLVEVLRASSSAPCPTCVRWWRCTD